MTWSHRISYLILTILFSSVISLNWLIIENFKSLEIFSFIILSGSALMLSAYWKEFSISFSTASISTIYAFILYQHNINSYHFLLKYLFNSQVAFLWMTMFYSQATLLYCMALRKNWHYLHHWASCICWLATTCGIHSLFTRWHESYLLGQDIGHLPFSNLYEASILFIVSTSLIYLWIEKKQKNLGLFIMLIIDSMLIFLLWYITERHAHEIQPLVPALRSTWMQLHVPMNFIGYGSFTIAATLGIAYLSSYIPCLQHHYISSRANILKLMHHCIMMGFMFFTIAIFLGSLWAADTWGSYWQWDPKETWALIVWLNYASWLHHYPSSHIHHPKWLAWWALLGLIITAFAFIGVNIFLSGLHSYGQL